VVRGRKGTIVLVFAVTMLATSIWAFTIRPVYTATATLRIEKEEPQPHVVVKFDDVVKSADAFPDLYQTQQRLLQSRSLANRVIELLALDKHPDFQEPDGNASVVGRVRAWGRERLAPWLPPVVRTSPEALGDLIMESPTTKVFLGRLSVDPVRNSRLIRVSFDSHYAPLAARVVNTLAEAFVTQTLEFRADAGRYASGFLGRQIGDARDRLEKSEAKLSAFVKANGINFVTSGTDKLPEREDLVTHELSILSDSLVKARNDRIAKEALAEEARQSDVDALPAVLQNPVVVKLKGDLATLEAQRRELGQTFRPEYPRVRRLDQSINELRAQIHGEVLRVTKGLEADYHASLQNERQLEQSMDVQRARAMQLGDQMVQYNILRRDVDANRELYTSLLTRLKETQISSDLLSSPISIVDRADVPLWPSWPRKSLLLALGGLVGLLTAVGAAYVRELSDPRLRNIDDVDRLLGVPRLGLVPERSRREGRRLLWPARRPPFALVAHEATYSMSAEAFRDLRTSLLYAVGERPIRTVMVTSPDAGDGKTALATNLAIALAQLGTRGVLLIDANLRHPELHQLLGVPRRPGLSAFLTGQAELPAVLSATDIDNLYVIPAGRMPDNPAELLASPRLHQALEVLSEQFTHVVIDTPPLSGLSDALNLAPRLDGVVLVLRHGRSERALAQAAVQRLLLVQANVLGVVVNKADARTSRQRYRRWNYYGAAVQRGDDDE
jgi:capsular exopolysaccharide synthesis family protein